MSEPWPFWFRPLWLLVLPLALWLLWRLWHRPRRSGRWQAILPPAFHAVLLGGGSGRTSKLPWALLALAWLLAIGALLGPSWQRVEQTTQKPADPLVVLFELTPEMLAADVSPNRLEVARRKLLDLLESRGQAQTAIIVYAGSAHVLVPLSDDLITSRNLLDALIPSIMPEPGQRADLAVDRALALLKQAGLGQGRLLLIASSLSDQERDGLHRRLGRNTPPLLMIGIGTSEGAPVTEENGELLKDALGGIALPRLDSASLDHFIDSLGGHYRQARVDSLDLRELGLLDAPHSRQNLQSTLQLDTWEDQGYWLLLPLLFLAACAGRRGWLFCLPLLLCLPQPSYAFDFSDLWWRADQRGQQLLEAQRPAAAAQQFEDTRWQGVALYEAGDYAGALERFAKDDTAAGHYNRGNALAHSGDLTAALDAYDQALERQPDLQPALKNRLLVQRLLKARQARELAEAQAQKAREQAAQGNPSTPPDAGAGEGASSAATADSSASNRNAAGADDGAAAPNSPPAASSAPPATAPSNPNSGALAPNRPATPPTKNAPPDSRQLADATEPAPKAPAAPPDQDLNGEQRQALEQWLRQIPDHPSELLRRKFWYEQQQRQDNPQ
ncbi:MAG: VWA domain-containing protein [Janthinobacterium lividum]